MRDKAEPAYYPERPAVRSRATEPVTDRLRGPDLSGMMLHLQRTAGNQAVNALLRQQQAAGHGSPAAALAGHLPKEEDAAVRPPVTLPEAARLAASPAPAAGWLPLQRAVRPAAARAVGPLLLGAGPVVARQIDLAAADDDRFNPESIVHDLRRFIDQSQATLDVKPAPGQYLPSLAPYTLVRKVDAAAVIRVLDNLTVAQVATVKRLYAVQEGRPIEQDLFETGASGVPSSLTSDQRGRIRALLQGTRAEGQEPGIALPEARLEADAIELHGLLQGDLDEAKRERLMALHRRPVDEITGLDNQYVRLYGRELSMVLGDRLTGLQRNRMAELRNGNAVLADACAIEDKRRALDELASKPLDPFHPDAREKERARLLGGIEGIVEMNSRDAVEDPANQGKPVAQAMQERLAAILGTPTGDAGRSLGDALATTLGPVTGGAIATMAAGGSVAEVAARRLLEMEASHMTTTEKIAELLHELRAQALHDVRSRVLAPSVAESEKQAIAAQPEDAVDAQARHYTAWFQETYDRLRGEGRSYDQILASARDYNADMLRALTQGGGQMSEVLELDHAIRKGDGEAIRAVLQHQPTQRAVDELVRQYEALPGHGPGKLRQALFGLVGDAELAMVGNPVLGRGLLTGRDAALAEEALRKPAQLGGADEVEWLASYGQREATVTEARSGFVGSLREIGGDPETQALMNESAAQLRALQTEWTQHDPWGSGRPRHEILAEMRRWRATLTGDAMAYEEDNARLVAEIRSAVTFAVQVALAVALPGIGEGFLATTALNIGATVASNMVINGDQYTLASLRNDVLGGLLGAAGGKLGEELVVEAAASRVAGDAAMSAVEAAERAGLSTPLLRQAAEASALASHGSVGLAVARHAGGLVGGAAGTTIATGENGFTVEGLAQGALMSMLGKIAGLREGIVETAAAPAGGEHTQPTTTDDVSAAAPVAAPGPGETAVDASGHGEGALIPPGARNVATGASSPRSQWTPVASEHPAGAGAPASRDAPTRAGGSVPDRAPRTPEEIPLIDLPEGSIMYGGDRPLSAAEARTMYENAIADSPHREVIIYENVQTGEQIVVQGNEVMVGAPPDVWQEFVSERLGGGRWRGVRHTHPIEPLTRVTPPEQRFPSGAGGDLAAAAQDAAASGQPHAESVDIVTERGAEQIHYGCDPHAERPYWVDYPDAAGLRVPQDFRSLKAYHEWYKTMTGHEMGVAGDAGPVSSEAPYGRTGPSAPLDPETGLPPVAEPGAAGTGPAAAGAPGGAGASQRPSVLIVGTERAEEFAQAEALAGQGRDVTVVNPRATEAARGYQATGGHFHEGGIETLPQGLQYDYIREEFPQPLGRTLVGLEAVQARFRRLAPGGRLEIVTEANAEEFRRLFDMVGESEYGCSVTTRELGPAEGPHSPAYVPAGERRIETVFVRPTEPAAGSGPAPASSPGLGTGPPGTDAPVTTAVSGPPAAGHVHASDPHAPQPTPAVPASPYDPVGRTDDELVQDMNRTPRPGETPPEAMARARDAAQALYLRQTLRTYHGLAEEPPILDMRAHDAQYAASGAHTTERHGPDIPLHRTDAPRGLRTIEGRIYGDPPWDEAANWSYKGVYAQTAENSVTHIQVQHARTGNPWGVVSAWSPKRQGFPYTSRRAARAGQPCAPALSPNGCFPTLLDRPSERVAPARCVTS